ncbi:MAG: type IX secretion system membrane protein PorP/SprF [Marinifilaceae bacterium]
MNRFLLKILFCLSVSFSFLLDGKAQDVEFSQYYANKIYLNPAFAGSDYDSRIAMGYRNQWPGINEAFLTYSVAYDKYVDVLEGGLGLHILQDQQGDGAINTTMVSGMYSYTLSFSRNFSIRAGFQASLVQRKLNYNNLTFPDMIDQFYITGMINPSTGESLPENLSRDYMDFSGGMLAAYKNWFVGVAAHHLSEPDEAFKEESDYSKLPRKYTFHCGVTIPVFRRGLHQEEYTFSPNFMYQQQSTYKQLNYGVYLTRNNLMLGVWYRDNLELEYDAVIFQVGISKDWWQLSYSYDKTVSKLIHTNTGAHEFSVLLRFVNYRKSTGNCRENYVRRKRRVGALKCPRF